MKKIANAVIDSMKKQEAEIALRNCFVTWDGSELDFQGMIDGIGDRFRLLGLSKKLEIEVRRLTLTLVRMSIVLPESRTLMVYTKEKGLDDESIGCSIGQFFHKEEQDVINEALKGFYPSM